ncbi:hypothetical protein STSP2_00672 [Anaerohalosphaera lusitana]|uniref:Uncharacterized protein n=1 Tax=Anaerohalosphaera lusitana TaxID=1936003 RepID=A0A1U9NIG7_9BACT|nr:hypothetical protein [Anaerohalosphaera lusitana]AQT67524.1 hypothetical protein STSP2_00672 [Anaerohalosphaera lusitana]
MAKMNKTMMNELQATMDKAGKFDQLADLQAKRSELMEKVTKIDSQINDLIGTPSAKPKATRKRKTRGRGRAKKAKPDMPEKGTGPYKLVEVMGSKPMKKEEIAKKTGLSPATVSVYLNKFNCFSNVRGKGYTVNK